MDGSWYWAISVPIPTPTPRPLPCGKHSRPPRVWRKLMPLPSLPNAAGLPLLSATPKTPTNRLGHGCLAPQKLKLMHSVSAKTAKLNSTIRLNNLLHQVGAPCYWLIQGNLRRLPQHSTFGLVNKHPFPPIFSPP